MELGRGNRGQIESRMDLFRWAEGKTDLKLNPSAGDRVKRDSNWGPPRRTEPDREPNRSGPAGGGPIERRIELVPWAQVKSKDKRRGINGIKSFTKSTGDIKVLRAGASQAGRKV